MTVQHIRDLLIRAAKVHPDRGIKAYNAGDLESAPRSLTYKELYDLAIANSNVLRQTKYFPEGSIVLLHFDDHLDLITWFWSTILAGCIPAMSTPLPNIAERRKGHLNHLITLLDQPICLTRKAVVSEFPEDVSLDVLDIEDLGNCEKILAARDTTIAPRGKSRDLAFMMLTSGSTGFSKAVCIEHSQTIASLVGKASITMNKTGTCMNWIRLDHVGSLVEIHLLSMYLGNDQVHAQPQDIVPSPLAFLKLIQDHRVERAFAPNFYLGEILKLLESKPAGTFDFDLTNLSYIISGGESNPTNLCMRLTELLQEFGAPDKLIVPGFGMTETCAGSIYHTSCPSHDVANQYNFASLGDCVPGIEMRISPSLEIEESNPETEGAGSLEVRGPIVFKSYYNNAKATAEAFTSDGWFKTGDSAFIDASGKLNFAGRTQQAICINGMNYPVLLLEDALENAEIDGISAGHISVFAFRPSVEKGELPAIFYVPSYPWNDIKSRFETMNAISKLIFGLINARPIILPVKSLERTTLGKLSRSRMKSSLARGQYKSQQDENAEMIKKHQESIFSPAKNDVEQGIIDELKDILDSPQTIGAESNMVELGLTSVSFIKLQHALKKRFGAQSDITLTMMLSHTTPRALAQALEEEKGPHVYNPVAVLRAEGEKTPLWLVHHGSGDPLAFMHLAQGIMDRPLYAFKYRGLHPDEPFFTSMDECVLTYHAAMKKQQPSGPYAIAGYEVGGVIAFEVAKLLESQGDKIQFLGTFNRAPEHFHAFNNVNFKDVCIHVAYGSDLYSKEVLAAIEPEVRGLSNSDIASRVIEASDAKRVAALNMDAQKLEHGTDLVVALQKTAIAHTITGSAENMSALWCDPVEGTEPSRAHWLKEVQKWQPLIKEQILYYECPGKHFEMLTPKNLPGFTKILKAALADKGL
ncbi:thioesterase domain protein [Penicillium samsonianum]|uniref:thioesterase domain protein n=1 Tax=Penicillium samsonianum TaxID=1882272 RepID=UPI002546B25D|nr:thioesterase domain protein [Penicillium samsonianum]KAJ6118969.1 thioesterase domain protein [Penicillium samsonianum]